MNIYEKFFINVSLLTAKEDKLMLVNFFVERLRKQKPHIQLIVGRGKCNLILAIFQKYKISHRATIINSGAAIFEKL